MSLTNGGYEPPETATAELEDELTDPEEDWSPLEDEDELDVVESDVVPADVEVLAVVPEEEEAVTPGIVRALTVPKMPTPARAAKATPAVIRLRSDSARSRAWILESAGVGSMVIRLRPASQSSL